MESLEIRTLAPICLFTFNRLDQTIQTVEALQKNYLASDSDLIIFSDAARDETEEIKVQKVRDYLQTISSFKSVKIIEAKQNKGLARSIVGGVSEIVNKYGKTIVLEDDLVTSEHFLEYMNTALDYYEKNHEVLQISGFMFPINVEKLPDTFFYQANTCWGWATWQRAWKHYDGDVNSIYENLSEKKVTWKNFNAMQGFAFQMQLRRNRQKKLNTWAVKWHAAIKINKGKVVHPKISMVQNIGLDGYGTNSKKEILNCDVSNVPPLDVTHAAKFENSEFHFLALQRLRKYFRNRYSLISILRRKFR